MRRAYSIALVLLGACAQPSSRPAAGAGEALEIFDGRSLEGWMPIGDGSFRVDAGGILAESTSGKSNSFLVTRRGFGDFRLTLELKNELPGNSGIQIRSRVVGATPASAHAEGYQIEIDPSPRAWSGGLYEERGRGWLQNLEKNEAGRKAFRLGEWNRYRIECVGPWIRAWVNDVPTADRLDAESLEGVIGLQVHSGSGTRIRFRDLRLEDLGRHEWKPVSGSALWTECGLRLTRTAEGGAGWRLCFQESEQVPALDLGGEWKQLTLLAREDRIALFRDAALVLEARTQNEARRPWVRIEGPAGAGGAPPFARVEALVPATR
jgi:putative component of toxin-antitoxin plasmid stabilization module